MLAIKAEDHTAMINAFGLQAGIAFGLCHRLHRAAFEYTGANARQHTLASGAFDDDRSNPAQMQQLRQQQAGRTGTDNDDVGTQIHPAVTNASCG